MARVFVAMSGGVDSSAAAALLVEQGHDVTGVTMRLLRGEGPDGCCSADGARSAKRVCDALGIAHYTLEFADLFERAVIAPYVDDYAAGRTPNPCIVCNDVVKWGELLRRVVQQGADHLATGHYARIVETPEGPRLARGLDTAKDQSYFLYRLTPEELAATMFPLGGLTKPRVRDIAAARGLPSAARPESQESCFVPDGDARGFVRERRPDAFVPGEIVDGSGAVVGGHDGVPGLTIGQRRGIGVAGGARRYVTGIDPAAARVRVGGRAELRVREVVARDAVWSAGPGPVAVTARTRYRGVETPGTARLDGDTLTVRFDVDVERPAPGQALVCYTGDVVLGGGVVEGAA